MYVLVLPFKSLHHIDLGSVANVSEVYYASIFKAEVRMGVSVHRYISFGPTDPLGKRQGVRVCSRPTGIMDLYCS
jgi:hypothetical protein